MPKLTLNQAAKEAQKAKSTILEAIRAAKLSAPQDSNGRYQIDPAELFRVYPQNQTQNEQENQNRTEDKTEKTAFLLEKISFLEQQLTKIDAERQRERAQLQAQIEREQEQADHWRHQATNLLTHQPQPESTPTKRGLLQRLFRGKPPI